jgi:hypothetical protein
LAASEYGALLADKDAIEDYFTNRVLGKPDLLRNGGNPIEEIAKGIRAQVIFVETYGGEMVWSVKNKKSN